MSSPDQSHKSLVAVVGPTATGKSDLALHLAESFNGEIVNADSRQVYRYMDIGTAKPSSEDRQRIPHHLIDILEPDQDFSLALFLELARKAVQDIHRRGKLPILAGGTGQYVWALLEGWTVPKVAPDPALRRRLEAKDRETLYRELEEVDPDSATSIGPTNVRRMIRALEVYHLTGVPFSQTRHKSEPPFRFLVLGLTASREELYRRIDSRVDIMMQQGWLNEVRELLDTGYSPDLASLSSLGYQELVSHIRGELSLSVATERVKYNTHRFARHQYAWFRPKDPRIHWLESGPDTPKEAQEMVGGFLNES